MHSLHLTPAGFAAVYGGLGIIGAAVAIELGASTFALVMLGTIIGLPAIVRS